MKRRSGARYPLVTRTGVYFTFLLLLLLLALCAVLVYTLLDLLLEPEPAPLSERAGIFGRSLFVPSYAAGSEAVIDVASTRLAELHADAAACPWLVLFYSDGCGHCRRTAPAYAQFAQQWAAATATAAASPSLVAAARLVQVTALNCREFHAACRQHRIHGVPTLKLLLPASAGGSVSGGKGLSTGFTETELEAAELTFADLSKLTVDAVSAFAAEAPAALAQKCLAVRDDLQLQKRRRLGRPAAASASGANGTDGGAAALAVAAAVNAPVQPPAGRVKGHLASSQAATVRESKEMGIAAASAGFQEERDVHASDIANALFHTLYDEVSLVGFDTPQQRAALLNFLAVVDVALPGLGASVPLHYLKAKLTAATTTTTTLPLASTVRLHPEDGSDAAPLSDRSSDGEAALSFTTNVTEWRQTVLRAGIPYRGAAERLVWRTCRGSAWGYRGFPCGMWLLYHSLTANYAGGLLGPVVGSTRGPALTGADAEPLDVFLVILDYARHFFSCRACREHFLLFTPLPPPTSRESAVLQLWRAHNVANYNLANVTEGADPLVPKRQFPDAALCPACVAGANTTATMPVWRQHDVPGSAIADAQGGEDGGNGFRIVHVAATFNETAVVAFLVERYAWDPTRLRSETDPTGAEAEAEAAAVVAAAAAARSEEIITMHRKPMGWNILLTMVAVTGMVGLGCMRVLQTRKPRRWGGTAGQGIGKRGGPSAGPGLITQVYGTERRRSDAGSSWPASGF